jgi:lysozyme family protein
MGVPAGFDNWIQFLLEDEGAEVNESPDEPGGISKYGVSLNAYSDYARAGHYSVSKDVIRDLTAGEAKAFYEWFFGPLLLDDLAPAVAYRIADIVANLGRHGGALTVQIAIGLWPISPAMTPEIIAAVEAVDPATMVYALSAVWLAEKAARPASWAKYGHGWTNRRNKVTARALALIPE